MAAVDIIENMTNKEIIQYYHYCMNHRLQFTGNGESRLDRVTVYMGKNRRSRIYMLHTSNEMYLLKQMMDRYENAPNLATKYWWESQWLGVFSTTLSWPSKEPYVSTSTSKLEPIVPIEYEGQTLQFLAAGLKRRTYVSNDGSFVIKVPKIDLGIQENIVEAQTYKQHQHDPGCHYAQCELVSNNWLKMEFVKPLQTLPEDCPEWVNEIAEGQVGYNLHGKLVAYDYGSER